MQVEYNNRAMLEANMLIKDIPLKVSFNHGK